MVVAINYYFWQSKSVYRFRFIVYGYKSWNNYLKNDKRQTINHKQKIIGTIVSIGYKKKEKHGPVNEEFKTH